MKDEQKQIEEMAKFLCKNASPCSLVDWEDCERKGDCGRVSMQAKALIEAGYCKIPENAVVLSPEERDEEMREIRQDVIERMEHTKKKTIKRLREKLEYKKFVKPGTCDWCVDLDDIDEICKEIMEKGVQNGN